MTIFSTGTSRLPFGPATTATARAAMTGGTLSAAGEALHRLPAIEARPWICVEPIRSTPSTMPGQACSSRWSALIMTPGVAAPITKKSPSSRIPMIPGMRLVSTISSGFSRPLFSWTNRSVPPDKTLA